jgi:hypothetical protein
VKEVLEQLKAVAKGDIKTNHSGREGLAELTNSF